MTEVLRYYSAFPTQVTDESHSRLQQYVLAEDFDRVTAERDQLQRDLDEMDQEIDRLRTEGSAMKAALDDLGIDFDGIGDMYAETLQNDKRYRMLRDRMCVEDFPCAHPEWSAPSENESRRIDEMCDQEIELENKA